MEHTKQTSIVQNERYGQNTKAAVPAFLDASRQLLGEENVLCDTDEKLEKYRESVSGEQRFLTGCVLPTTTEDVQKIVQLARTHHIALHPISTGKNWGLGSGLPVQDGAVVVDLRRLNKIREINTRYGYAVVEAGVTQRQLCDYLKEKQLPYRLDLTGSGADTSIVGNVLEGGVGYFGLRFEQSSGFEVVMADGTLLHTGYGHYNPPHLQHLYRYGVGPSIDGLFIQSAFGIVTAIGISLMPVYELYSSVICTLKDEKDLRSYIDLLGSLRTEGIVNNNIKIGNYYRSKTTLCPLIYKQLNARNNYAGVSREEVERIFEQNFGGWSAVIPVAGEKRQVKLAHRRIREKMKNIAKIRILDQNKLKNAKSITALLDFIPFMREQNAILHAVEPLFNLCQGVPTDATLPSLYWPSLEVPDDYMHPDGKPQVGMIAYLPIIPLDGQIMDRVQQRIVELFQSWGFIPNITITMVNSKAMWGVIDMPFDRSNNESLKRARQCISQVTRTLCAEGIVPQRVGIDYMEEIMSRDDPYWKVIGHIKNALDPTHVLSPGRYHFTS